MPMGLHTQNQASSTDTAAENTEVIEHGEHEEGEEDVAEDDEDDEENDDEDADAEAEEIARRLNDQLWAEINKAQAEAAAATKRTTAPAVSGANVCTGASGGSSASTTISSNLISPDRRVHEALKTMQIILKDVANDPLARTTLSTAVIPGTAGISVLDAFNNAVSTNDIPKAVAKPLSHLLVSLARSDVLFSSLRHSDESSIQLKLGKRQRDEQNATPDGAPPLKRPFSLPVATVPPLPMPYALHTQLDAASRAIISALASPTAPPTGPPPPPLIASIQFPLHQVFLFAMTAAGPARNALQELGGLIQALGVLSGVPIGGPGLTPWGLPGTSVHPCTFPGCGKTFARLYSLRAHARVHAAERPFRCTRCPAAFARNHDLKRHERLHDDKAWQCTGCAKAFSRRDALTRHRNAAAARHSACATADVAEIEVSRGAACGEDELRRTRVWHGASEAASGAAGIFEDGELPPPVLSAAQEAVVRLHPVLQACVVRALGGAAPAAPTDMAVDAAGSQATLASALARAQAQLDSPPNPIVLSAVTATNGEASSAPALTTPVSSLYGLSLEQTQMLEQAIASAASAAQLQAEAEAALEEEDEEFSEDEAGDGDDGLAER